LGYSRKGGEEYVQFAPDVGPLARCEPDRRSLNLAHASLISTSGFPDPRPYGAWFKSGLHSKLGIPWPAHPPSAQFHHDPPLHLARPARRIHPQLDGPGPIAGTSRMVAG